MKHRKVGTAMTIDVVRAVATTPFKDIVTWLDEHGISGMPVVDDDEKVIGVVSVSDLMSSRAGRDGAGGRETGPGAGPEAGTGGLRLPRLGHTARRAAGEDGRAPTAGN